MSPQPLFIVWFMLSMFYIWAIYFNTFLTGCFILWTGCSFQFLPVCQRQISISCKCKWKTPFHYPILSHLKGLLNRLHCLTLNLRRCSTCPVNTEVHSGDPSSVRCICSCSLVVLWLCYPASSCNFFELLKTNKNYFCSFPNTGLPLHPIWSGCPFHLKWKKSENRKCHPSSSTLV